MRIAFDAKRAFQNTTGLGHYSRTLIKGLATMYPEHEYYMAAPKPTSLFDIKPYKNVYLLTPGGMSKTFSSLWRSNWVKSDLKKNKIDLYHGLSHEIPVGIQHTGIRSVVTIHDLIFEKYPQQYNPIDVTIYRKKFRYACMHADKVIAISEQTKKDIVELYNIPAEKISVVYNSCDPSYSQLLPEQKINEVKTRYSLPADYLLYVGSIIERKNLLNICKALHELEGKIDIPLVVIGTGSGKYYQQVKQYVKVNNLKHKVIFLSEEYSTIPNADFPAIYQGATALLYPSVYEGFGLPILEAMYSNTPVITSNVSCMPEVGGDAAIYVDPYNAEDISGAIFQVCTDATVRDNMAMKGLVQADKFNLQAQVSGVMNVYSSLVS
jgi:glycosyltransferase involved in cell wall biosynthesis